MASTRNINCLEEYTLERQKNDRMFEYKSYKNSSYGTPIYGKTVIPEIGPIPNNVSRETFAENAVDIESMLRGTGESNLVSPKDRTIPLVNRIPTQSFFDRPYVANPEPLVVEKFQRPNLRR
jgi:hypothetical protein